METKWGLSEYCMAVGVVACYLAFMVCLVIGGIIIWKTNLDLVIKIMSTLVIGLGIFLLNYIYFTR